MSITPQEVYREPDRHIDLLTSREDRDFEGQFFDRKEAGRPSDQGTIAKRDLTNLLEQVDKSVSAFANVNVTGGLLVLGIAADGTVKGLEHLTEDQLNSIMNLDVRLTSHGCQSRLHHVTSKTGKQHDIALFLVSPAQHAICETVGSTPRAWIRRGFQNVLLNRIEREKIERDKGIVNFEKIQCTAFIEHDIDVAVIKKYREYVLDAASYDWSNQYLLRSIGAVTNDNELTNAGALFFSSNPQREIPSAYIRILRFDVPLRQLSERPPPSFDRSIGGPITKQIRNFRSFITESGFFKTYLKRRPQGGFEEIPELPPIAVDEAIVNAVSHRDYAIGTAIRCEKYTDGLVVRSPGTILQGSQIPEHFTLDQTQLEPLSRNTMLLEWLRNMKDPLGKPFVLALGEGTRKMRDEMAKLGLCAPEYDITGSDTVVTLRSNAPFREAEAQMSVDAETGEFSNLYPLMGLEFTKADRFARRQDFIAALGERLKSQDWFIDHQRYGVLIAHRRGVAHAAPREVSNLVRIYPSAKFQFREYYGNPYLLVDITVSVKSVLTADKLTNLLDPVDLIGLSGYAKWLEWERARIISMDAGLWRVFLVDYEREELIKPKHLIPHVPRHIIERLLGDQGLSYDLAGEISRASAHTVAGAPRHRAERTQAVVNEIIDEAFPLKIGRSIVRLLSRPLYLTTRDNGSSSLRVDDCPEPVVEFRMSELQSNIREGITKYGSYDTERKDIELIPICAPEERPGMQLLIDRLRHGHFKFRGSEKTFSTRLGHRGITTAKYNDIEVECRRLVEEYPEWKGADGWPRLFLVHCPEAGYSIDDEQAPYFRVKRFLLESGIPCQMVDTPTIRNPDYKDLNLALNIVAKCGVKPWVLPDSISDADFFVGLSYTRDARHGGARTMGFANVFNQYGRWEFYSGGGCVFSYEDRARRYEDLISSTLERLPLSDRPSICFHYSARFSREDRSAILRGARKVRPNGVYFFVWINRTHSVRFYDSRPDSDGSLARGRYVVGTPNQIYISTTGNNPYRKALGTPRVLEVNVHVEGEGIRNPPDLRAMAGQILCLTKLNWSSSDSLCAEPITTKYAGDVAYLTSAFLRQDGEFVLHPVLERTPWFI